MEQHPYVLKCCKRCRGGGWRKALNARCPYCAGSGLVVYYRLSTRMMPPTENMIEQQGRMVDGVFIKTRLTTEVKIGQTLATIINRAVRSIRKRSELHGLSIKQRLILVFRRDLKIDVYGPEQTYYRHRRDCKELPSWLIYDKDGGTYGSRFPMWECVRRGIWLTSECDESSVRLVEPKAQR